MQARGCAFVVMKKRNEADLALRSLKNQRFYGHTIRVCIIFTIFEPKLLNSTVSESLGVYALASSFLPSLRS